MKVNHYGYVAALLALLIIGCGAHVIRDVNKCPSFTITLMENGCTSTSDGVDCHLDFLQPKSWGRCFMEMDNSLVCQSGNVISHYRDGSSSPDWKCDAALCRNLADAVKKYGQDATQELKMEIVVPPPQPPPSSKKSIT